MGLSLWHQERTQWAVHPGTLSSAALPRPLLRSPDMSCGRWKPTMVAQGVLWVLLALLLPPEPGTASLPLLMDSLVQALSVLEKNAEPEAGAAAAEWPLLAPDVLDPLYVFLLDGQSLLAAKPGAPGLSPEIRALASELALHSVQGRQERGVVLAPDGSTVAVQPLLAGLQAGRRGRRAVPLPVDSRDASGSAGAPGFRFSSPDTHSFSPNASAESPTTVDSLLGVTLARNLGLAFLHGPQVQSHPGLGSDGCWDQLSAPRNFTLLDPEASPLTLAFLNGALDGLILGDYLSRAPEPQPLLSHLLGQYYGPGVAGDSELRSNFRRQNAAPLTETPTLAQQVWGALLLLQKLEPEHPQLQGLGQEQLAKVATHAATEFTESFLGCPAIHPRCLWGAAPYKGSPKLLQLPLSNLYVHHTYLPSAPCTDLAHCAADMRSMQSFHQKTRGWDDIGYSFVVGSDGYVYEGRGWRWVGAHTRGHNTHGFGVAIIGNYSAQLPAEHALRTVRLELPQCAVRAGLLRPDYALLGHRQLVATDCPGEALFQHLRSWPHFYETKKRP
ncbi:N-acetylmuramoyl-L-alanine amidase [Sorex fumeus]|uniref:N-acetylmuramoyl-L-alanine amidase n=1 Tax=Sorex fumeus TaxID=62283 RepID=UPI0024ADDFF3|nr:N-acetylmuramoyl-L-alanine amidase [Sorex fumeus]